MAKKQSERTMNIVHKVVQLTGCVPLSRTEIEFMIHDCLYRLENSKQESNMATMKLGDTIIVVVKLANGTYDIEVATRRLKGKGIVK